VTLIGSFRADVASTRDPPIYTLRRGQSWLRLAVQDGTVVDEHLEPREEAAFDFLEPVLVRPP